MAAAAAGWMVQQRLWRLESAWPRKRCVLKAAQLAGAHAAASAARARGFHGSKVLFPLCPEGSINHRTACKARAAYQCNLLWF